jgi:hypothetical protein
MKAYRIPCPQLETVKLPPAKAWDENKCTANQLADRICEWRYLLRRHYNEDRWTCTRVEIKPTDSVTIVIWHDGLLIYRHDKYGDDWPWLILPKDAHDKWHITAAELRQVIGWLSAITYDDLDAALQLSWREKCCTQKKGD